MSELDGLWREIGALRRRVAELEALERVGSAAVADTAGDADTVDTLHASAVAAANTLLALDAASKLPASITGDADTVDGLHAATSGADAHVLATDASGNVRVDGHLLMPTPGQRRIEVPGTNATRYGVIEAVVRKQLTRATDTAVLTVTTTDESGSTDAGSYQVYIEGVVHASAAAGSQPSTARGFARAFARTMNAEGGGVNTPVLTLYNTDPASNNASVRKVGVPTVTVVETSEYVQTVTINCDVTGTGPIDPIVTLFVRIEWGTFVSAPVVAVK